MVLLLIVALVRLLAVEIVPVPTRLIPSPNEAALLVELVIVFPVITASLIVPLLFDTSIPESKALVSELPVTVSVPLILFVLDVKAIFDSPAALPETLMVPFVNEKLVTDVPSMPLPPVFWMFTRSNETFCVLVNETPLPVVFWIVPPLFAVPVPFTLSPPLVPVVFRIIPFVGPLAPVPAEILRNSRLFEPMVVLATFNAVPVVVVNVFALAPVAAGLHGFSSHTLIVPPPVAVKAGFVPVEREIPPENVIVAPELPVNEIPVFVPLVPEIAPVKMCVLAAVTL